MTFVIVTRDDDRKRDMFWACDVSRFTYYEEHATEFVSEDEARAIMKYCETGGAIRAAPNTPATPATVAVPPESD